MCHQLSLEGGDGKVKEQLGWWEIKGKVKEQLGWWDIKGKQCHGLHDSMSAGQA
jgi:hypothetical protein